MASNYPAVRAKIVEIIEATTLDDNSAGVTGRFVHSPSGIDKQRSRAFQIQVTGGNLQNPGAASIKGRFKFNLRIGVLYVNKVQNTGDLDATIGSDVENLILQLISPENQDRANSGIILFGERDGGESSFEFEVTDLDDEATVVSLDMPAVFERGVETN